MNYTNIASIDQSLSCTAICIFGIDGSLKYFECIKTTNAETDAVRISTIASRIIRLYTDHSCNQIVCEGLSFGSMGDATRKLASLLGVIENKFYETYGYKEIPRVAPTSLKKFATGNGKAKKIDMLTAVPDNIVESFLSAGYLKSKGAYDLADAYHIGKWWIANNSEINEKNS